jgi:hypothetical protein
METVIPTTTSPQFWKRTLNQLNEEWFIFTCKYGCYLIAVERGKRIVRRSIIFGLKDLKQKPRVLFLNILDVMFTKKIGRPSKIFLEDFSVYWNLRRWFIKNNSLSQLLNNLEPLGHEQINQWDENLESEILQVFAEQMERRQESVGFQIPIKELEGTCIYLKGSPPGLEKIEPIQHAPEILQSKPGLIEVFLRGIVSIILILCFTTFLIPSRDFNWSLEDD